MESWTQRILLSAALAIALPVVAADAEDDSSVLGRIITPDMERRQINEADLDTEDFEIGAYYGYMSIEDFGTNEVKGLRLAYHVTEGVFLEAAYGQTRAGLTSFERLAGATRILTDEERDLSYYNLSAGINVFPGEIFIADRWSINSSIYLLAGVGNTHFAEEDHFTTNIGAGLRLLPTDWLAVHIDTRGHIFEHDLLGEDQTVINLEAHLGLTVFF